MRVRQQGDFTTDRRLILLSAMALVIGALCAVVAVALMWLIGLFTNLFFFHRLSIAFVSPADHHLGLGVLLVPVFGGLINGLMARFGSERIRGHGIPEAMEAILIGRSRMEPKVAATEGGPREWIEGRDGARCREAPQQAQRCRASAD